MKKLDLFAIVDTIVNEMRLQIKQKKSPERKARLSELEKQFGEAIEKIYGPKPAKITRKRPQEARTDSARPKMGKLPQGKLKPLKNES